MNRKGFTLIEVLAVIIVLSIILVIAAPGISNVYKNSKLKSEEVFTNRLSSVIDSYIKLNTDMIGFTRETEPAIKENQGTVTIYKGKLKEDNIEREIIVNDIINDNLLSIEDYVNAGNKYVKCNLNTKIEVYRDSDFVYCHKVEASSLGCITEDYIKSICPVESETCYAVDTCIWSR